MAKKRKASRNFEQPQAAKSTKFDVEERFDNSEDEFYAGREKILLDEDATSKRRRNMLEKENDLQPSDEEILGYHEHGDETEDQASDSQDDFDDAEIEGSRDGKSGRSRSRVEEGEDDEASEDEHWGVNRADYYDADVIETEADAIEEENEAKRLHQKQIKNMTEADFGFDEDEWADDRRGVRQPKSFTEKLPDVQIPANATTEQKLEILRSRYPELLPLAADFVRLQPIKEELDIQASVILKEISKGRELDKGIPIMAKRDALAAYLAAITTYFVVLSSRASPDKVLTISALPPLELHEHGIIQSLARARGLWDRVAKEETAVVKPSIKGHSQTGTEQGRSYFKSRESPMVDEDTVQRSTADSRKPKKPHREHKSQTLQKAGEKSKELPEQRLARKEKRKKKQEVGNKVKFIDLNTLVDAANAEELNSDSEFGDEQPLTQEQFAEKDRKRKSLRFYTSQIASKANKRGVASREAGGDDDLPYKERKRDRQERLMKAAEAKGRGLADVFNDEMDNEDYDALPNHQRPDQNDEYYDQLLNASTKKKAEKKAKAEAYAAAAQEGAEVFEEETVGADGKRAITYAIAKNKGLAPKRKKEVRNPRVKKRKKFDEKMKKLGSMKQVYKGGEGRGGYGGELTGIKTNIVKSVKL